MRWLCLATTAVALGTYFRVIARRMDAVKACPILLAHHLHASDAAAGHAVAAGPCGRDANDGAKEEAAGGCGSSASTLK